MNFESIFNDVWRTLGSWFLVVIVYTFAYVFIDQLRKKSEFWNTVFWNSRTGMALAYPFVIFWIAIISWFLWAGYGMHTEDGDPLRGGGDSVVDFSPTDEERNEYAAKMFFILGIPAMVAVYKNYNED